MKYAVRVLRRAKRDHSRIVRWISERSKPGAESWIAAYEEMLTRLSDQADTLPLALENDEFEEEIREVLFKTRRGLTYRTVFTIVLHDRRKPGPCLTGPRAGTGFVETR